MHHTFAVLTLDYKTGCSVNLIASCRETRYMVNDQYSLLGFLHVQDAITVVKTLKDKIRIGNYN